MRVTANVDAYATRLAAALEPFPNPSAFVAPGARIRARVLVPPRSEGLISVGTDLFNQCDVFNGSTHLVTLPDNISAQYVRMLLIHDPSMREVALPDQASLSQAMQRFTTEAASWNQRFSTAARSILNAIMDERLKTAIRDRALTLLYARWLAGRPPAPLLQLPRPGFAPLSL